MEDTRHGRPVGSRVRAEDTQVAHGVLAVSQVRAVVDQERVGRAEDGVQVHLAVIHTNLDMAEDTLMEEVMIQDTTMDMAVIQVVGRQAANLGSPVEDLLGLLVARAESRTRVARGHLVVERVASLVAIHLLRAQDLHGIHQEVVTPNLPTVVVLKMMATVTLVAMEANGTRGHLRHREAGLLVASRVRAEEVVHPRLGAHHHQVNLASLDTEE